jgi:hypothetical protein
LKVYNSSSKKITKKIIHIEKKNAAATTTTTAGCSAKGLFSSVYLRGKMNFSSSSTSFFNFSFSCSSIFCSN